MLCKGKPKTARIPCSSHFLGRLSILVPCLGNGSGKQHSPIHPASAGTSGRKRCPLAVAPTRIMFQLCFASCTAHRMPAEDEVAGLLKAKVCMMTTGLFGGMECKGGSAVRRYRGKHLGSNGPSCSVRTIPVHFPQWKAARRRVYFVGS